MPFVVLFPYGVGVELSDSSDEGAFIRDCNKAFDWSGLNVQFSCEKRKTHTIFGILIDWSGTQLLRRYYNSK